MPEIGYRGVSRLTHVCILSTRLLSKVGSHPLGAQASRPKSATHPEILFKSMVLGRLSSYLTSHVNRFGLYHLELDRQPPAIDYKLPILCFQIGPGGFWMNRCMDPMLSGWP
jgi:hypothetical protein